MCTSRTSSSWACSSARPGGVWPRSGPTRTSGYPSASRYRSRSPRPAWAAIACMLRVRPDHAKRFPNDPDPRPDFWRNVILWRLAPQPAVPPGPPWRGLLLPAPSAQPYASAPATDPPREPAGRRRGDDRGRDLRDPEGHRRGGRHRHGRDRPGHRRAHAPPGHLPAPRRGGGGGRRGRRRYRGQGLRRGGRQPAVKGSADAAPWAPSPERASAAAEPSEPLEPVSLEAVQANPELSGFISAADRVMEGLGYTEHGFRHANLVARISYNVLTRVGFDEHTANLASVSGYLHDVGNMVSRE